MVDYTPATGSPLATSLECTRELVQLMIWYVWQLHRSLGQPIGVLLDERVDIVRKTTLFDGARAADAWQQLKRDLSSRIALTKSESDSKTLERDGWEYLRPYIDEARPDPAVAVVVPSRPFQCWRYERYRARQATIAIHFANAYLPESPFRDRRRDLVATLRALLREVAEDCPDVKWVHCGSWLNRYSPFLGLFPQSWSESFTAVNAYWNTQGWWGQYVTHRGTFHRANAERLRREGRHPYECGNAWCSVVEAIAHVEALQ